MNHGLASHGPAGHRAPVSGTAGPDSADAGAGAAAASLAAPGFVDLDPFGCPLEGITLIEASAGTGKTWNLAILYLRALLERDLTVEQVLVMTFTNAATAELRERLRARLVQTRRWLEAEEERGAAATELAPAGGSRARADAAAATGSPGAARSRGRHGANDPASGDDPKAGADGAADEVSRLLIENAGRTTGLTRRALRDRLDAALAAFDEAAIVTIHGFCQRALARVPFAAGLPFDHDAVTDDAEGRLQVVADFWRRRIAAEPIWPPLAELLLVKNDSPARWAELLAREIGRPLAVRLYPDDLDTLQPVDIGRAAALYAELHAAWQAGPRPPDEVLHASLAELNGNRYKPNLVDESARLWQQVLTLGEPLGAARIDVRHASTLDRFAAATLADATKRQRTTPRHPFFDAAQAWLDAIREIHAVAVGLRIRLLRDLIDEGGAALRALRRTRRLLTFDDMLFNLREALAGGRQPWLAGELFRQYPLALVDEFQDTDSLQYDILSAIYPQGPLFLIGDPKQAIYSFRSADLHVYLQAQQQADARLTLRRNQRSTRPLIDACNALFSMNRQVFGIELGVPTIEKGERERPPLIDDAQPDGDAALRVWTLPPVEPGRHHDRNEAKALAARATAAEIDRLLARSAAGGLRIGDRPLGAGDIAVLVRTHVEGARVRRALAALGIDSVELSQIGVFQTAEAEELERVLLAIGDPAHQGHLLSALATGLVGRDAAAIDALADDEPALLAIAERWLAYRELWLTRGFGRMFQQWMTGEGVDARLLAQPDGERRMTDLLHVAELLQRRADSLLSIDALLRWLSASRQTPSGDEETQTRLESDRNLVQIVTIHRAKGLEYGVVFCPFLWDGALRPPPGGDAIDYHDDDGRLCVDFRPGVGDDRALKDLRRFERHAEHLRLIYVAMTRAVYRCYLVAGLYRTGGGATRAERSLLNWLVAGDGMGLDGWPNNKLDGDTIMAAWQALQQRAPQAIRIERLPPADPPAGDPRRREAAPVLRALTPPVVPAGWRIGSFSSLRSESVETQAADADAADHDVTDAFEGGDGAEEGTEADLGPVPSTVAPATGVPLIGVPTAGATSVAGKSPDARPAGDDFLDFPRGPSAGDCLHAVFERLDFTDPATTPAAIEQALQRFPQSLPGVAADEAQTTLARMLQHAVDDVLSTRLPTGFRLRDIGRRDRLIELGFHLPAPRVPAVALERLLRDHGMPGPRLVFGSLAGYLTGFIDLVVRHRGRYYLVDWKSNHLGDRPADYAPPNLARVMDDRGYHLQYALYSVALDRLLRRRVTGYDTARDFGGVLYLFARGMRPGWVDRDGQPTGVSFHRPSVEFIRALDDLIAGGVEEGAR